MDQGGLVDWCIDWGSQIDRGVDRIGFHEWQDGMGPAPTRELGLSEIDPTAGQSSVGAFVIHQSQSDLALVTHA